MVAVLTLDLVNKTLDELVAEKGEDYVYERNEEARCTYVRDGAPSCIVGHLLAKIGVPIEELAQRETRGAGGMIALLNEAGFLTTAEWPEAHDVEHLLAAVQINQDSQIPWGQAVQSARSSLQSARANY